MAIPATDRSKGMAGAALFLTVSAAAIGLAGLGAGGSWLWLTAVSLCGLAALSLAALARARQSETATARSRRDYRELLDFPAQATWLADAEGRLFTMGERWTEWTGLALGAEQSSWVETIHPEDQERVVTTWQQAIRNGTPHDQDHRVRMRDGDYRWMRARAFPRLDERGAIVGWVGQVEDIHERKAAEEQLRHTAGLLEMIGTSTDSIIWAKDREGRMLYLNRALERLAGITLADVVGKTDLEWNPNRHEAEMLIATDRQVLESGEPVDTEEKFTGHGGSPRVYRTIKSPLRDRTGAIIGTVGVATDITERKEAEQREQLLTRELDHRAKNLLAVVQSVVTLTRASSLTEFKDAVHGRIQALGRAHSMLAASRWEGADLGRIMAEELTLYDNGRPGRLQLEGPPLILRPAAAQSLALVIHELATNAVKYGCLSSEQGQLMVSWEVGDMKAGVPGLRLTWTERGGPAVPAGAGASRNGFGTRLIHSSIERQLGGSLSLDWATEGLVALLEVPLERPSGPPGGGQGPDAPPSGSTGRTRAA